MVTCRKTTLTDLLPINPKMPNVNPVQILPTYNVTKLLCNVGFLCSVQKLSRALTLY
jgi:hypothetical protein